MNSPSTCTLALPAVRPGPGGAAATARPVGRSLRLRRVGEARARRLRLLAAGALSAGAHAFVLFALNTHATLPADARTVAAAELPIEAFTAAPTDDPPPPASADARQASLPEPLSTAVVADITAVIAPSPPVLPRPDAVRWSVPSSQMREQAARFDPSQVFQLSELDHRPELVASSQPVYPPELATTNITGVVVVRFIVSSRGDITQVEVVSAPHPLLGTAVTRALARWKFRAGTKNGRPVNTEMELPVRFNLSGV